MPSLSSVQVDRILSNFATDYQPLQYIAQMVSPWVPVQKKSGQYFEYTKKDIFTLPETIRGETDYPNEVDWSMSTATYSCITHALSQFITDELLANSDQGVNPLQRTVNKIVNLMLLDYERRVAAMATTYGNYGAGYRVQLAGGDRWDVYATSDPLGAVETGRQAMFYPPNKILMGYEVWAQLKYHPQILDRISGGSTNANPAMVTKELVAELFEVDELLVGMAKYNTANKAQTASYSYVWGKDVVLFYSEDRPSLDGVCAWKTFRWNQNSTNTGYKVERSRDERKGGGGTYIDVTMDYDEKAISTDVAYIIDTVIS